MSARRMFIVAAAFISAVSLAATLVPYDTVRLRLDAWAFDGSADPYTPQLHVRLHSAAAVIGTLALLMAAALVWAPRRWSDIAGRFCSRISSDAKQAGLRFRELVRGEWAMLCAVAIVALGMRLCWISQPIRYDEATSWLEYASQPLFVTVSKYDTPNNHVFHNLCMAVAIRCFGSTLIAIRLTALIAGVLTCVWTAGLAHTLCRSMSGNREVARFCGLQAGLLVSVSSLSIEYSTLGRGYSLVVCLSLLCWITARGAALTRNVFLAAVSIIFAAIGLWTIPVMLYPLVMITLLLLWDPEIRQSTTSGESLDTADLRHEPRPVTGTALLYWLVAAWAAVMGLAVLLYLPVLLVGGVKSLAGNSYVTPIYLSDWCATWPQVALRGQSLLWRDVPIPIRCFWIFGIAGLVTRPDRWPARLLLLAALVVPVGVMPMLQRVHPPSRVWLYLIPVLAVFSAWGWSARIRLLKSRRWAAALSMGVFAAMVVWPGASILINDPISKSEETGQARHAREAIEFLKTDLQPAEPIVTVCPASAPIRYYAEVSGLEWIHFDWPMSPRTRDDTAIVVVSHEGDYDQSVDDVLAELKLQDDLGQWSRTEIWSLGGLTLYRLNRP